MKQQSKGSYLISADKMRKLVLVGALLLATALTASAVVNYDPPVELKASKILPPELVSGPDFRVEEAVINDGYLNYYKIHSRFDEFPAVSTAKLRKRIREINAMAVMEDVEGTKTFASALMKAGLMPLAGAKALITKPFSTVYGTIAGIGQYFRNAGDSLFGKRSRVEESRFKDIIGFARAKRRLAYRLGVDVYSRNETMQKHLNQIAWAAYAGNLTMSAALAAVPGGAGIAITVSSTSRRMNEVFRTTPPSDLRRMNRKKLDAMKVNSDIADLFIDNPVYSPREQTLLVAALDEMIGTSDRGAFVKTAGPTDKGYMAFFRQRQAELYAGYHRNVEPIERFEPLARFVAARTSDGKLVFCFPLDHLSWTETMAGFIDAVNYHTMSLRGITGKQLWVTGTVSPLARKELTERGVQVHERMEDRLLETVKVYPNYEKEGKTPSGTVEFKSTSIALGVGVSWGDGHLKFKGKDHAFSISGLSLIDLGFSSVSAKGDVFDLNKVSDLEGTYVAAKAAFALVGGAGEVTMKNGQGILINLRSDKAGAALSLGPAGVTIKLK